MTRGVRDEYGFLLVALTDEGRLARMDDQAARQIMAEGSLAFELFVRLLRGQISRAKLSVDEREAKERERNKRQRAAPNTPRSSHFKEVAAARAAMSPEEIRAANAAYAAKDREKKGAYRKRPEVLERSRELQRGYRLRQGVPVGQATPAEPTPTLADGLDWMPMFTGARPGDESYQPDAAGE